MSSLHRMVKILIANFLDSVQHAGRRTELFIMGGEDSSNLLLCENFDVPTMS